MNDTIPMTPEEAAWFKSQQSAPGTLPGSQPSRHPAGGTIPMTPDDVRGLMADPNFSPSRAQARIIYDDEQKRPLSESAVKFAGNIIPGFKGMAHEFAEGARELKNAPSADSVLQTVTSAPVEALRNWADIGKQAGRVVGDKISELGGADDAKKFENYYARLQKQRLEAQDALKPIATGALPAATRALSLVADPTLLVGGEFIKPLALAGKAAVKVIPGAAKAAELAASSARVAKAAPGAVLEKAGALTAKIAGAPQRGVEALIKHTVGEDAAKLAKPVLSAVGLTGAAALPFVDGGVTTAVVGGLKTAQVAGTAVERAGQFLSALAKTDAGQVPRLLQMANNRELPEWLQTVSRAAHRVPLVGAAARMAGELGEGALHGAATGAVLSLATGQNAESAGQMAGGGALLGGAGRGVAIASGHTARLRAAKARETDLQNFYLYLAAKGTPQETIQRIQTTTALEASALQAATARGIFAKRLDFDFLPAADFVKRTGSLQAAAFDGKSTITINLDAKRDAITHEIAHATAKMLGADSQARAAIDTILTPAEIAQAGRQYAKLEVAGDIAAKGGNPAVLDAASLEHMTTAKVEEHHAARGSNQWIYDEIYADAGWGSLHQRDITRALLPRDGAGVLQALARSVTAKVLDALGLAGETAPQAGRLFSHPAIYGPEMRKLVLGHLRDVRENGPKALPDKSLPIPREAVGRSEALPVSPQPDGTTGNSFYRVTKDGKVVERSPAEIKREDEKRRRSAEKASEAFDKQPVAEVGDPDKFVRLRRTISGLLLRVGELLPKWFYDLPEWSDASKEKARQMEQAIANGDVLTVSYFQAGAGRGVDYAESLRRARGSFSFSVRDVLPFGFFISQRGEIDLGGRKMKTGGNILLQIVDLATAQTKAQEWAQRGKLAAWGGDVGKFMADFRAYIANHANGRPGETGIGTSGRDTLNAFIIGDNVTHRDKNPLRALLRGAERQGLIRSFRLDRIEMVKPTGETMGRAEYDKKVLNLSPDVPEPEPNPNAKQEAEREQGRRISFFDQFQAKVQQRAAQGMELFRQSDLKAGDVLYTPSGTAVKLLGGASVRKDGRVTVLASYTDKAGGRVESGFFLDQLSLDKPGTGDAKFSPDVPDAERAISKTIRARNFKRWAGKAKLVRMDDDHVFKSGVPVVVEAVHGTTHDFDRIDADKGNVENDFGKGFYASTTPRDVAANYAGEGPDLTSRIERLAEQKFDQGDLQYGTREYEAAYEKAKEEARRELSGPGGRTMKVFIRLEKPLVLGGEREGYWERSFDENFETESGEMVDFINALQDVSSRYDEVKWPLESLDNFFDGGRPSEIIDALRKDEGLSYATDETGDIATSQIIREALERMGYDGVIDQTVNEKFGSARRVGKQMEGVDERTTHVIAFTASSVKSATGNRGTFDRNDPRLNFSPDTQDSPVRRAVKLTDKTDLGEAGFIYHATNRENAHDIVSSGKLNTHRPNYGTDQSAWPDKGTEKRSYWSTRNPWNFAPEEGEPVVLRTRRTNAFLDESTGDIFTRARLPATAVEILTDAGWQLLVSTSDQFHKLAAPLPEKPTPQDIEHFKTTQPKAYKALRALRTEALRREGYTIPAAHSTNAGEFSVFKTAGLSAHFGTEKAAKDRAEALRSFSEDVVGRAHSPARVMPLALKIEHPLEMPDLAGIDIRSGLPMQEALAEFKREYPSKAERERRKDSGDAPQHGAWESETDFQEHLVHMGEITRDEFWDVQYDTDAAIALLKEKGYDGIKYRNDVEDRGSDSYIVFDPEQVKSAEPLALDGEGRLITPEQWGASQNPDIRFSPDAREADRKFFTKGSLPKIETELPPQSVGGGDWLSPSGNRYSTHTPTDEIVSHYGWARHFTDAKGVSDLVRKGWVRVMYDGTDHSEGVYIEGRPNAAQKSALEEIGFHREEAVLDDSGRLAVESTREFLKQSGEQFSPDVPGGSDTPRSALRAPHFYSQLERFITAKLPNRAPAAQVAATLRNPQSGIKAEEMKWRGMDDFLQAKLAAREPVTREELLDVARANSLEVKEVLKGGRSGLKPKHDEATGEWQIVNERGEVVDEGYDNERAAQREILHIAGLPQPTNGYAGLNDGTQHGAHVVPGGENYRELLLTLPEKPSPVTGKGLPLGYDVAESRLPDGRAVWRVYAVSEDGKPITGKPIAGYSTLSEADAIENAHETGFVWSREDSYRGSHWDEPNVLAHVRFNERTDADGAKVLFLEEIQSDWHQEGRKKGYRAAENPLRAQHAARLAELNREYLEARREKLKVPEFDEWLQQQPWVQRYEHEMRNFVGEHRLAREREVRGIFANWREREINPKIDWKDLPGALDYALIDGTLAEHAWRDKASEAARLAREVEFIDQGAQNLVPDAPFKTTWPELAFKRMVRWAAEHGFDRVAWTPGDVHFKRWGSEEIAWLKHDDGWQVSVNEQSGGNAGGIDIEGEARARGLLKERTGATVRSKETLAELLGNQLAREHGSDALHKLTDRVWERMQREEAGTSLPRKEGMEGFYDKMLVDYANKLGKKFGTRARKTTIANEADVPWRIERREHGTGWERVRGQHSEQQAKDEVARLQKRYGGDQWGREYRYVPESGTDVHALDITSAMRKSALEEGFPMFSPDAPGAKPALRTPHSALRTSQAARARIAARAAAPKDDEHH